MLKPLHISILLLLFSSFSFAQKSLFYCSNVTGTYQVYHKNLETSAIIQITDNNDYNYWWVEISADKNQLLLMRSPVEPGVKDQFDYENCQMLKTDIGGANPMIILDKNQYGWNAFGNPHWHPTEDKIIILAQPTLEFFLFTIDSDGSNPQQLTTQFSLDPNWSNDGNKIVYIGLNPSPTFPPSFDDFEIFTADYDFQSNSVSNQQQLTDDTKRDQDPCFSPNNSTIAFSSGTEDLSTANIVTIDSDGDNRNDLVNDNTTNGGPVNWGTDNKIYYHNVDLFVTPFTAKSYNVTTDANTDLFPTITESYISPLFVDFTFNSTEQFEKLGGISIYPNPLSSTEFLSIEVEDENLKGLINIYAIGGQLIVSFTLDKKKIQLNPSLLQAGYYTIEIISDQKRVVYPILVKN